MPEVIEVVAPPVSKDLKKRWSHFIRKVYETDPLTCPKCEGEMRIISFIDQPEVIKKNPSTLRSVGRVPYPARKRSSSKSDYLRSILQPGNLKASVLQRAARARKVSLLS